ncbi:hypothetical protein IFO69_00015 [Echinicola sp. CAU 1574]|uniref:Uncharacterized protein n=1 Tax=Echinicola arenosa TaxID=2774144 RepID=A0ABR9AEP8_9BACT|nr:hypothetical protein [Echinicola arenosa]MBD8487117.1 hypothetical protein [Echinicola arenosa]
MQGEISKTSVYQVIYQLFDRAAVNYYLVGVDRLFYSGVYEPLPIVSKSPVYLFSMREYLIQLIQELKQTQWAEVPALNEIRYCPDLFREMIDYEEKRLSEMPRRKEYSEYFAPWEYIPKNLKDKEFRKPLVTLRHCLIQLESLDYVVLLKEMQDNAFSGQYERWFDAYPELYALYFYLKKLLEACYVIYAGELRFGRRLKNVESETQF